jgi:leucyl-tRNA synthetase
VLHLLYARFWHKVLYDCGLVHTKEPFQKLFNQGMVLAYSYKDERGKYYLPNDVEERDGAAFAKGSGEKLVSQIEKMSKSKLNVFSPDEVIEEYGADAMRLYELFMGPLDQVNPWQMSGVEGVHRFLQRTWRLVVEEREGGPNPRLTDAPEESEPDLRRHLHATIEKVGADTDAMRFNTAIAQMMTFVNEATSSATLPRTIVRKFVLLVAPYAPHVSEELWERLGEKGLIAHADWPSHDSSLTVENTVTLVVQVNGKRRDRLDMPRGAEQAAVEAAALRTEGVQRDLAGRTPRKVIIVPDRLVNIVV